MKKYTTRLMGKHLLKNESRIAEREENKSTFLPQIREGDREGLFSNGGEKRSNTPSQQRGNASHEMNYVYMRKKGEITCASQPYTRKAHMKGCLRTETGREETVMRKHLQKYITWVRMEN